jgi:hypothetical protein
MFRLLCRAARLSWKEDSQSPLIRFPEGRP